MKRFVLFFIVLLIMVPVFASDAISLSDYLASSEYSWFLTGKTEYSIQAKMVSAPTDVYNPLEDVSYTAEPNGEDVILKGTSGEE